VGSSRSRAMLTSNCAKYGTRKGREIALRTSPSGLRGRGEGKPKGQATSMTSTVATGDVFDARHFARRWPDATMSIYLRGDSRMFAARPPAPLFRTHVEGLRHVLARQFDDRLRSSCSPAHRHSGPSATTAPSPMTSASIGRSRRLHSYAGRRGESCAQDAREAWSGRVALCVSTTYGPATGRPHRGTDR